MVRICQFVYPYCSAFNPSYETNSLKNLFLEVQFEQWSMLKLFLRIGAVEQMQLGKFCANSCHGFNYSVISIGFNDSLI